MKKRQLLKLLYIVLVLFLCVGCNHRDSVKVTDSPVPETTSLPKETTALETTPEPTKEPVSTPAGTTDKAVINGMTREIMDHMTLEEKVGQLFIVNLELLDDSEGSYYEWREKTDNMVLALNRYHVGGVILFSRNIETREQTRKLIEDLQGGARFPLFVSVDEEGGSVSRIASNNNMGTTVFPDMAEIGATEDEEYAYTVGSTIGEEIGELGFNLDFAPVADVSGSEMENGIGSRSFGSSPKVVGKMVNQVVKGLQDQNISATLKHFPGHGAAAGDTHNGGANVDRTIDQLRKTEFVPFKAGIKAGADFIMVSHVSLSRVAEDTIPSSLSSLVLKDILRTELGFDGIVITDAMNMKAITDGYSPAKAAILAIKNGADMILMPEDFKKAYNGVLKAVKEGRISEERIDEAVRRILKVKVKRGMIPLNTDLIPEAVNEEAK